MTSDPNSWKEVKAEVAPGPIWAFTRGYRVNDAGRHENEKEYRAFQFYLNSGSARTLKDTAEYVESSPATIAKLYDRYNWAKRCAAFDKKEMQLAFREANKMERSKHRKAIQDFRQANEEQAKQMMEVSSDLVDLCKQRIQKALDEGEDVPMGLVSGLLRASANMSDSSRQAWATSLGVGELMQVVDQELEEVQVEIMEEDIYEIPLDE